jgi:hypothetical protein
MVNGTGDWLDLAAKDSRQNIAINPSTPRLP